jgi:putative ABC transport system permease protein
MTLPGLSPFDLVLAGLFSLLAGVLSLAAGVGLERAYLIGLVRMVVQLGLAGLVLKFVIEQGNVGWTLAVALVMLLIAAVEGSGRLSRHVNRSAALLLSGVTMALIGGLATAATTGLLIGATPWHAPAVVLPLLGMILGNALSAFSLALITLTDQANRDRPAVETRLAVGATRFEALARPIESAVRTGLTPVVNGLAVAGVVALPGMMTGQILAGIDPLEAAKYQIMILAVLAGTSALAVTAGALGGVLLVTDRRHRLRGPAPIPSLGVPHPSEESVP